MRYSMHLRLATAIIMTGLFNACAHNQATPSAPINSAVADLPKIPLLPPASAQSKFSASQTLSISHNGQSHQLEALLEWDQSAIHLAIVKFGKRIMTVNFDGSVVDVQKEPFVPKELQGDQILRDIQLVYWPSPALKEALPTGYTMTDFNDVRTLSYQDKPIYRIVYHANHNLTEPRENNVQLQQLLYGYEMTIHSLPNY